MYRSTNRFIPRQVVRRSTQLVNQLWTGSPTQSQLLTSQPTSSATTTRSNMTDAKKTLDIQIISDNICPFCYLGKKKIEAAVATLGPDVKVNYDWRPFQLDPTLPTESVNKIERYKKKFGADRVGPMLDQMKANGRPYGIEFSYGGNIGNTVNSHRLVDWSKQPSQGGGQHTDALINKLFNAYFEREADIASLDTLADIGSSVLPASREEVMTFLKSDQLRDHVLSQMEDARNADVSGVPHFIIDGKYSVSGAQEPQTFQAIFKKLGY